MKHVVFQVVDYIFTGNNVPSKKYPVWRENPKWPPYLRFLLSRRLNRRSTVVGLLKRCLD